MTYTSHNEIERNTDSKQLQQLARDFFQREVAPLVHTLDKSAEFPLAIYQKAWDLGLMTAQIPESYGGLGLSWGETCLIAEEVGAVCAGVGVVWEVSACAIASLLIAGNKQQCSKYLGILTKSCSFPGLVLPAIELQPESVNQVYLKKQQDSFILNGKEIITLNGNQAAWYLVPAIDPQTNKGSLFLVDKNHAGLKIGKKYPSLGLRCADITILSIENLILSSQQLVGAYGEAQDILTKSLCFWAPVAGSLTAGICHLALEKAINYAKERYTFGQPIAQHQSIAFLLADMARNHQAAKLMNLRAAQLIDNGHFDSTYAKMACCLAMETSIICTIDAVQIFGGYGYSKEYPVEKLMRDAKMMQMIIGAILPNALELRQ